MTFSTDVHFSLSVSDNSQYDSVLW